MRLTNQPNRLRSVLSGALLILSVHIIRSAEKADSVTGLQEIEVTATNSSATTDLRGNLNISSRNLELGARVLGEADLVALLKRQPGVSSTGDYGSGININGAAPWQSLYTIDGAPVYFPYRFSGLFSTFNTGHFSGARFERSAHTEAYPSRLGALLAINPYRRSDRLKGEINVGLLASSLCLRFPVGSRFGIGIAGRISYINQIYGKWIKTDDTRIVYDFLDLNLTAHYLPDDRNRMELNLFGSNDVLSTSDHNLMMDVGVRWRNALAALSWTHEGDLAMSARLFMSGFFSRLHMDMTQLAVDAPADLMSYGGQFDISSPLGNAPDVTLRGGLETTYYAIEPQWTEIRGMTSDINSLHEHQNGIETRMHCGLQWTPSRLLNIDAGLSASLWHIKSFSHFKADPRITLCLNTSDIGTFNIHAGGYTQYLNQAGFSEIGLATNFWFCSDQKIRPQHSWTFSAGWHGRPATYLPDIDAEIYYSYVTNQSEFEGGILDLTDQDYNSLDHIIQPDGFNTGLNLSVNDNYGPVNIIISYSLGTGKRHSRFSDDRWNSLTSQGNRISAEATWHTGPHWDLNARFQYSQGRTYTPVKAVYAMGGNIALEYGERNSARLPDYQRLDLSATYSFSTKGKVNLRHLLNLSVINAYGHKNVESQTFSIDRETGRIRLRRYYSLYRFLPSISYTLVFQ